MDHGSNSTYVNHRCRCKDCRKASREYARKYVAANRDKVNAYMRVYNAKRVAKRAAKRATKRVGAK